MDIGLDRSVFCLVVDRLDYASTPYRMRYFLRDE